MDKVCTKCKVSKPTSEYFKCKQQKSGLRPDCKSCNVKRSISWHRNNRLRSHGNSIKYMYGISATTYAQMLALQNGVCAICKGTNKNGKRLSVDHCHNTNKVRGLLCHNCNMGLGYFRDTIDILKDAISYLENSND